MSIGISVFTDQVSGDLKEAAPIIAEWGVQDVDLRKVFDKNVEHLSLDEAERAKDILSEAGLRVACVATRLGAPFKEVDFSDPATHAEEMALLEHILDLAKVFDTSLVRTHVWRIRNYEPGVPRPNLDDVLDEIVPRLRDQAERADSAGVTLVVENEAPTYLGSCREAQRIFEAVAHPNFRFCWDIVNGWRAGEYPHQEAYLPILHEVKHVHIKGAVSASDENDRFERFALPGKDDISHITYLTELIKRDYAGFLAVDPHVEVSGAEHPVREACRQTIQYLRELLNSVKQATP